MDTLKQNLLSKISNKKERDAVKKALDMITTKYDMQIMNAKSSQSNDSELQTKYNRISEFNKELLARYKKEQEKTKQLESQGKDLQVAIEEKEKQIAAESEHVDSLKKEIENLASVKSRITEMEAQASSLLEDIKAKENALSQEKEMNESMRAEISTVKLTIDF